MKQSHRMSICESIVNIIVGAVVAYSAQVVVFPMYNIHVNHSTHLQITAVFTGVSFIRSYVLRRIYEHLRIKGVQ